jgi:transcriptional regulator with XRE-family HTH domain
MHEESPALSITPEVQTAMQNAALSFSRAFGEEVKANRLRLGLRQDNLAAILQSQGIQVSQSYISRLESGQRVDPSVQIIVSLAILLDISLDRVLSLASQGRNHASA